MAGPELVGLPVGGPATVPQAKDELGIDPEDVRDDARLQLRVDAVNAQVRSWPCSAPAVDADDWAAPELGDVVLGANMLVARLFRRKNSPAGVESFGSNGAVYVMRTDPDIAQMLKLGAWSGPQLG